MTGGQATALADLTGTLTPAGEATWDALAELAAAVPVRSWAVVGGQMVALHAAIGGVAPPRLTTDGDVVVDVRAHRRRAMTDVAVALVSAGFEVQLSPDDISRYRRARAAIDLLAPEGLGARPVITTPPGRAVQAPGATQALQRAELVRVRWGIGEVVVRTPSLLGAVIVKAAAATEIVARTGASNLKHEQDLVFLLSLLARTDLRAAAEQMSPRDRRRVRGATDSLLITDRHPAWSATPIPSDAKASIARLLGVPPR